MSICRKKMDADIGNVDASTRRYGAKRVENYVDSEVLESQLPSVEVKLYGKWKRQRACVRPGLNSQCINL